VLIAPSEDKTVIILSPDYIFTPVFCSDMYTVEFYKLILPENVRNTGVIETLIKEDDANNLIIVYA